MSLQIILYFPCFSYCIIKIKKKENYKYSFPFFSFSSSFFCRLDLFLFYLVYSLISTSIYQHIILVVYDRHVLYFNRIDNDMISLLGI